MEKVYTIQCGDEKINLQRYMEQELGFSARRSKKLLKDKKVKLNGKIAYWDNKLKDGDELTIDLTEKLEGGIAPQKLPLDILYEDEYLLAVNKPPFVLVHPTPSHPDNTLANAVSWHFLSQGLEIPIRFLNRLDMNTSGIVIMPKSPETHSALGALMDRDEIKKTYAAVAEGMVEPKEGRIDLPLDKDPQNPIKRTVLSTGQNAITLYKTLEILNNATLLELELITGRTHQIRVHLSHLGYPIVGDTLYGHESDKITRQALHASDMELLHPFTGNRLHIHAELPEDMRVLIQALH